MRVFMVQKADDPFLEDFRETFERKGHTAELLRREELGQFRARVLAFKPDFIFCVGTLPALSEAVQGAIPIVYYELDKIVNAQLFSGVTPAKADVALAAYGSDVETFRDFGFGLVACFPFCVSARHHGLTSRDYLYDVSFAGSISPTATNDYGHLKQQLDALVEAAPNARPLRDRLIAACEEILAEQERATRENRYALPDLVAARWKGELAEVAKVFRFPAARAISNLAKEAAFRQRIALLRQIPDLNVFGPPDWESSFLPNATYRGKIDHYTAMSAIDYRSKINISHERIYARDGLSDRVFNCLYSEGFLLADRNDALEDLFVDREDLVMFDSFDEIPELVAYYLAHDEEREAIARRGREQVLRNHLFEHRADAIVEAAVEASRLL